MMEGKVSDKCVYCSRSCGWRQQALQCDVCSRWQHRTCHTGITQTFYRRMNKGLEVLEDWKCHACTLRASIDAIPDPGNTARGILDETSPPSSPTTPPRDPSRFKSARRHSPSEDWPTPSPAIKTPLVISCSSSEDDWSPPPPLFATSRDSPSSSSSDEWPTPPAEVATPACRTLMFSDSSSSDDSDFKLRVARLCLDTSSDDSESDEDDDDRIPPPTYTLIEAGTQQGKPQLVDTHGHSYSRKRVLKNYSYWGCIVRGKGYSCPAAVKQTGATFTPMATSHNHWGKPGLHATSILSAKMKTAVLEEPHRPVQQIVKELYNTPENANLILPSLAAMIKRATYHRRKHLTMVKN